MKFYYLPYIILCQTSGKQKGEKDKLSYLEKPLTMVEKQESKHDFMIESQETKKRENVSQNSQIVFFLVRRSQKSSLHDNTCASEDVLIPKMFKKTSLGRRLNFRI